MDGPPLTPAAVYSRPGERGAERCRLQFSELILVKTVAAWLGWRAFSSIAKERALTKAMLALPTS